MIDKINMHSLVLMHYSIALTNGSIIESSFDDDPIEIILGNGDLTEGMELSLFGLEKGDSQTLTLTPEQGFGIRDEDNIHDMPVTDFPDDLTAKPGLSFSFETSDGKEIPGTVVRLNKNIAEVDFNHPLAGHEIIFTVNILDINNAQPDNS